MESTPGQCGKLQRSGSSLSLYSFDSSDMSQFWKQFFEASANVSLSGYEEANNDGDTTGVDESTAMREDTEMEQTPRRDEDITTETGADQSTFQADGEDSLLDDAELAGSTPRPPATRTVDAQVSMLESPYERMKREMKSEEADNTTVLEDEDSTVLFAQRTARLPDISFTPQALLDRQTGDQSAQRQKDPLLHRVLDKNYRLQTTPHKPAMRLSPLKGKERETPVGVPSWQQDSPMSSPEISAPKLRSEAFMSPYKSNARQRLAAATQQAGPRTPGVSVQTPGTGRKTRDAFAAEDSAKHHDKVDIDWDIGEEVDDDDDDLDLYAGMSPPKTIQFALPPSKLLQTPGESHPILTFWNYIILTNRYSEGSQQEDCR